VVADAVAARAPVLARLVVAGAELEVLGVIIALAGPAPEGPGGGGTLGVAHAGGLLVFADVVLHAEATDALALAVLGRARTHLEVHLLIWALDCCHETRSPASVRVWWNKGDYMDTPEVVKRNRRLRPGFVGDFVCAPRRGRRG